MLAREQRGGEERILLDPLHRFDAVDVVVEDADLGDHDDDQEQRR